MATRLCCISPTYFLYAFLLLAYPSCSLQKYIDTQDVILTSLLASDSCNRNQSSRGHRQGSSLEVVHLYGPCIGKKNEETKRGFSIPNQEEMLLKDQVRVDSMHARFSKFSGQFKEMKSTLPLQPGTALGVGNYVVTVGIGTPKKDLTLIFDTGSDITWTQCQPCAGSCHSQSQPIFDPRKSSSYKNLSCSSSYCKLISDYGGARGCSGSTCIYGVAYGDGTKSIGFFATEKLTISPSAVFSGFLLGCGQQNTGSVGRTAGLLALGPAPLSLPLQTAKKFKKIFSYCIPSSSSSTGRLSFGDQVPKSAKYTPISPDFKGSPYYGIEITAISVGGKKLSIDASVFSTSGAIIDSGTVITRLQPTAYAALSAAFKESMKKYPRREGISILDTCYDLRGYNEISIPKMSIFLKGGVELDIKPVGILIVVGGLEKTCLAFAANGDDGDFAIFGNTQQRTYEVVHDLAKERVGFASDGCN